MPSDRSDSSQTPGDINPDVVAQSPAGDGSGGDTAPPERPSVLDRIRALETKVFGQPHPADDCTD